MARMAVDHDRLFKQLLTVFFADFVDLFLPQVAAGLDRSAATQFLDKEVFTDVAAGDRHEVDLLARVRLRGGDACILVHVENQSSARADFARRMFHYYARLDAKFRLPVYPVAVFSYDRPLAPAPHVHAAELFGLPVLRFEFHPVQLNALDWRAFLRTPNPVAAGLMAKMRVAPADRPHVKAQCARMIATLRLDPARSQLIWAFMNRYLDLTAAELAVYHQDMQNFAPDEQAFVLEIENEWTRMGRVEGRVEGQVGTLTRQLRRRFGDVPADLADAIGRLTSDRLDGLADALLEFASMADAQAWVAAAVAGA